MDANHFDFQHMDHHAVGRFTPENVREIVNSQFGDMNLTMEAKNHLVHELGSGRIIAGKDFHEILREAHDKGLITLEKAQRMRDAVRLPREII
jgi:hypothetical protein